MPKYIMIVDEEIWVESEYGTVNNVYGIESDLNLSELHSQAAATILHNDSHRDKVKFFGVTLTGKSPEDGRVNLDSILTLDEWFESVKRQS